MPAPAPDIATQAEIAAWASSPYRQSDAVTPALINRFLVTLGHPPRASAETPLGLHLCLGPEAMEPSALAPDGLALHGGIIPTPRHLTGRLWGGDDMHFLHPLKPGDAVEHVAQLAGFTIKSGRAGRLAFAQIRHDYIANGITCITETQTIAFRDPTAAVPPATESPPPREAWDFTRAVTPDHTMLLRFSALTFNAHRIHFDAAYARSEGYPDLLVHGPLTAALLLDACAAQAGAANIARFTVKALHPAFCGEALNLSVRANGQTLDCAALNPAGFPVMRGTAALK